MSVLSNIEFSILNTNLVKETEDSKKIKFKHESYLRIWKKYDSFCVETKEKMSPKFSNLPEQTEVKQPIGPENIVVHIKNRTYEKKESQQEKLKDQVYILKIAGTLLPQFVGRRALKIKDTMKSNMLENNRKACQETEVNKELPVELPPQAALEPKQTVSETKNEEIISPDIENIKVSKNGSTNAKITKYNDELEMDKHPERTIEPKEEIKPVSEILLEQQPKEKFKFTIPQIKIESLPHNITAETQNDNKFVVSDIKEDKKQVQINDKKVEVAHLKDSLTKANQLKEELEKAKKIAEKAKADAEMAKAKADAEKKEAEIVQEKLVETMRKLEEHNRKLEEEKKQNEKEAEKYAAESQEYLEQGKEYSSMQEEYKQTINEMLAIIG